MSECHIENKWNVTCHKCDQIGTNRMHEVWRCQVHYDEYAAKVERDNQEYVERQRVYDLVKTEALSKIDFRLYFLYKYWAPSNITLPYEMFLEIQKYLTDLERNYYGPENRLPLTQIDKYYRFPCHEVYIKNIMKTKGYPIKSPQTPDGLKVTDKFERYNKTFRVEIYDGKGCNVNFGLIKINTRYYINKCLFIKTMQRIQLIRRVLRERFD